MKSRLSEYCAF